MLINRTQLIGASLAIATAGAIGALTAGSVSAGSDPAITAQHEATAAATVNLTAFPLADSAQVGADQALQASIAALGNAQAEPARLLGRRGGPFEVRVVPLQRGQYCLSRATAVDCTTAEGLAPFTAFGYDAAAGRTTLDVVAPGGVQGIVAVNDRGRETPVAVTDGTGEASFDGHLAEVRWAADGVAQRRAFPVGIAAGPKGDQ